MDINLNLNETPVEELNLGAPLVQVSPELSAEKAARAKIADPTEEGTVYDHLYSTGQDAAADAKVGLKAQQQDAADRKEFIRSALESGDTTGLAEAMPNYRIPTYEEFTKDAVTKAYAKALVNTTAANTFAFSETKSPETSEAAYKALDVTEKYVAVSALIRDRVLQEEATWDNKTGLGKAGSILWGFIPLVDTVASSDALEGFKTSSWLKGNNIAEQVQWLWLQEPEAIPALFNDAIEEVRSIGGDVAAREYASAFLAFSTSDQEETNIFGAIDVVTVIPVGAPLKTAKLGKALVKGSLKFGPTKVADIASSIGEHEIAALRFASDKSLFRGIETTDQAAHVLPGGLNVMSIFGAVHPGANNSYRKLMEAARVRSGLLDRVLKEGQTIDTMTEAEVGILAASEFKNLKSYYPKIKDTVNDYEVIRAETRADNVDTIKFKFTKTDGTGFDSQKAAETWAKRYLPFKEVTSVSQDGSKFFVYAEKPIGSLELSKVTLSVDQEAKELSPFMRSFLSDSQITSKEVARDKRSVSDAGELTSKLLETIAEPIRKIGNKKAMQEFEDTLEGSVMLGMKNSKSAINTDGKQWMDVPQWTNYFRMGNGKLPTDAQVDAYVAYRQISDLDYTLRELAALKYKKKLGAEHWIIKNSEGVEGIQVKSINFADPKNSKILILDKDGKAVKSIYTNSGQNKVKKDIDITNQEFVEGALSKGTHTLIQPLKGYAAVGDDAGHFLLIPNGVTSRRAVKFGETYGYNPGGHRILKHPFLIQQGVVEANKQGSRLFKGTKSIWNVVSRKQGQEIVERLEEARKLKNSGADDAFEAYVKDNLPEITPDDINWTQPFRLTTKGEGVGYQKGIDFDEDMTDGSNLLTEMNKKFLSERSDSVVDVAYFKQGKPIEVETAKVVRPVEALNIGIRDALNQHIQSEFVSKSVDNILRQYSTKWAIGLDAMEIKRNPIAFLANPKFADNTTKAERAGIQKVIDTLNDFLQTPNTKMDMVHNTKEKIVEWAIGKYGPDSKVAEILDERLLHKSRDPAAFFRSVAFHSKMGLFNPKQFALQSQIFTNIAAIGGVKNALSSMPAMYYSKALWFNNSPEMLEAAAEGMTKFGWKKEHFIESQKALSESGWDIVGGSTGYLDHYTGPSLVKSKFGEVLDAGTFFFRKGEEFGRVTAWHTSYLNWKKANPTKALDRKGIADIRLRASDLTANMSRDMNASWQRGWASVPTQFWGFQARIFEQFLSPSSRLTVKERARLFAGISTMYGVPVGVGATVPVWPWNESVKKYITESGLDGTVDENVLLETMRDGILSSAIEAATGSDFDTSPYGPAGYPIIKDIYRGDKDMLDLFGGASAGIILQGMQDAWPFAKGVYYSVGGGDNEEGNPFSLTTADILDATKFISSVSNTVKIWKAANTGQWISSNETVLGDIGQVEAAFSGILGIELETMTDSYLNLESSKDIQGAITSAKKEIQKEYARARLAAEREDDDAYQQHIRRALALAKVHGIAQPDLLQAAKRGLYPESLDDLSIKSLNKAMERTINE